MSSTLSHSELPVQAGESTDWGVVGERLVGEFPELPATEVLAELVHAHEAALYVGTPASELSDVVEFMAAYALKVRLGLVTPSDRLDPERHAVPQRAATASGVRPALPSSYWDRPAD